MVNPFEHLDTALQIRRTFQVSREKAFEAWTKADVLRKWFSPGGLVLTSVEVDLRVGGRYRFIGPDGDGNLVNMVGVYLEIRPPEKLVFTWSFEISDDGAIAFPYSTVTLDFVAVENGTEIILTHTDLPNQNVRDNHRPGWLLCFDKFEDFVGGEARE